MKKGRWLTILLCYMIGQSLGRYKRSGGQKRGYSESRSAFVERVTRPHMKRVRVVSRDYEDWAA